MLPRAWTTWTWLHVEVSSSFGCRPGYRLPCNRKWEKLSASIVLSPFLLVAVAYIPVVRTALFSLCPSFFPFFILLVFYFVLLALISTRVPSVLAFLLISILSSRFDASIKLILYHFSISFFLPRGFRFLSPCWLFVEKALPFFSLQSSFPYFRIGVGFTSALLPSIFLTSSPRVVFTHFSPTISFPRRPSQPFLLPNLVYPLFFHIDVLRCSSFAGSSYSHLSIPFLHSAHPQPHGLP